MRLKLSHRAVLRGLLFASPWIVGFLIFQLIPLIASAYFSLTNFNLFQDPQFAARQNLVEVFDPREGRVVVPNVLPKLSETPGELKWLGPDMGQHNDEIYCGRLGMSAEEIERLKRDGIS